MFIEKIKLPEYDKINLWLLKLEEQMQESLGNELEKCIGEWKKIKIKELKDLVLKYPT